MISGINNSVAGSVYSNNTTQTTQKKESAVMSAAEQKSNKIEQLKESINSGNYKIDLSSLSEKMADELL